MAKTKSSTPQATVALAQEMAYYTSDLIKNYFPSLKDNPSALYVMVATLYFESGFRLLHSRGGQTSSMHYLPKEPGKGAGAYKGYYGDASIQNLLRSPSTTVQQRENINQGLVAHGLSATMGYYYVAGTTNSKALFSDPVYAKVASQFGLLVQPGQSITSLFAGNGEQEKLRSIASGLCVLERSYRFRLKKSATKIDAIKRAAQDYLGVAGAKDMFGTSPAARGNQIASTSTVSLLAQAGINADGNLFTDYSPGAVKVASAGNPDTSRSPTTVAATEGNIPGCSA